MGPVVAVDAGGPVELLYIGAGCQAQVGGGEVLFDAQQVDRRGGCGRAEGLASHLAAKALPQTVQAMGITGAIGKLMASHPPLEERIDALRRRG